MKTKKQKLSETRLVCPYCNSIETIHRRSSKRKPYGHLKWLWCYKCRKRTNHFEICSEQIEEEQ